MFIWRCGQQRRREDQSASTEADTKTAFEIKAEDISELSIENGKESYHFSRKEDKWTYTEDENFPLSESQIQNVVSNLTSISAVRELENTENLADYGLDNLEIQVTVTDIEGKETELKFGDINDAVSGCYMSKSGSHKVYLVTFFRENRIGSEAYRFGGKGRNTHRLRLLP